MHVSGKRYIARSSLNAIPSFDLLIPKLLTFLLSSNGVLNHWRPRWFFRLFPQYGIKELSASIYCSAESHQMRPHKSLVAHVDECWFTVYT